MQRSDDDVAIGIEREFRFSLRALAAEPAVQVSAMSPGCVTCELYEDFVGYLGPYLDRAGNKLTASQREKIQAIVDALEGIADKDHECFDNETLATNSWREVRSIARMALDAMGWQREPAPRFKETEPGIWRRP
ncbi:MAG: hypothetical protein MI757_21960 [Pirellulales bacterium]|nr:hypothetical protein [Pirellulales bacterium]